MNTTTFSNGQVVCTDPRCADAPSHNHSEDDADRCGDPDCMSCYPVTDAERQRQ